MQLVPASVDRPVLTWNYKGQTYATNKVIVRHSDSLRDTAGAFWRSLIRPSYKGRTTTYQHKECLKKEIYWSYKLMPFIHKNLTVTVRVKPFSKNIVDKFI